MGAPTAEFNESPVADEQKRIGELIRSWFFAPQSELHRLCPRDVIRNEELGRPNVIPHEHLDEIFDDDCPLCRMMREEAWGGEGDEWHFGLAPDITLLDEYDPEGYEARWADEEESMAKPEARGWLRSNGNEHAFCCLTRSGALSII